MMHNYPTFVLLATLLILVPGPDYILLTKNTIAGGQVSGFKTLLGCLSALVIHTTFAVVGLSAILVKSAVLFTTIKWVGAAYLVYLGIKALFQKDVAETTEQKKGNLYLQGLLTNLLNPKVAVFFLTFLPQFVTTDGNWLDFSTLGLTYVFLTGFIFSGYVLSLNKVKNVMQNPKVKLVINKISGIFLLGFGVKLMTESN
ncbi:LysE family translocator [Fructilactobacillus vespulae]|uniref:LysE family translocator n=1 Tax=Fructilactobacillus vespulae TaxID=1249630 RepID=UPI0039B39EFB